MAEHGYTFKVIDVDNLSTVKDDFSVPFNLQSCHTAIVDGYIIEGHVPVQEVERLLQEKPDISGIAVPGMPIGSPGMEMEGFTNQPFEVIAFSENGLQSVFAQYSP